MPMGNAKSLTGKPNTGHSVGKGLKNNLTEIGAGDGQVLPCLKQLQFFFLIVHQVPFCCNACLCLQIYGSGYRLNK